MKKLISLLTLLILLLPLGGCFGGNGEVVDEEPVYDTYEGVLKSLGGIKVSRNATHILQTEDGEVLYVYSEKFDLDDNDYIGNHLDVYGEVTEASDKGKDVLKITKIEIIEEIEDEDEEVKQETYENMGVGFSWDIMSDWEIEEGSAYVTFFLPQTGTGEVDQDYIMVNQIENAENLELAEWLDAYSPTTSSMAVDSSIGEDSLTSLEVVSEMEDVHIYYISRTGGFVYELSHYNFDIDNRNDLRNLFFSAVNSFKFIPFDEELADSEEQIAEEEETTTEETESSEPTSEVDESTYTRAIDYIVDKIDDIAPESPSKGDWSVTEVEFAAPFYAYVTYKSGDEVKRVLLKYGIGPSIDYEVLAYFTEGNVADWDLAWGDNEAKGLQKTLHQIESEETIELMEGYFYFESAPYDFTIQYPETWYYSGGGGHYGFSDSPDGAELVGLEVLASPVDQNMKEVSGNGQFGIYVQRDEDSSYYLVGSSDYEDIIRAMAGSIVD